MDRPAARKRFDLNDLGKYMPILSSPFWNAWTGRQIDPSSLMHG
jgi:hypothetical protein